MASDKSLFQRLTKLFRSGPIIKRKVRTLDTTQATVNKTKSSGVLLFQRSSSPSFSAVTKGTYNLAERMMRYQDYQEMETYDIISSALDVYADESVSPDEKGRVLHVNSDNERIKQELEELFYNTLNVEFNLRSWTRNAVKYGDAFLFHDVSPEHGVVNVFPIPVNEIEREENYDANDPFAVRYRWVTMQNRILENWEVSHFRLLGNDMFLPYGASVIESARRIWRQLMLLEDAMLVYRITRAPERRVFKIDVGNVDPSEVEMYMEEQRRNLRTNQVVDPTTGRVDLRYNVFSIDEDFLLPVRGKESGTNIETLQGGQNTAAVEDVAYFQKKLFAALKVPKAYLSYDDETSSKASLAQLDIRFSRTIGTIQKTMLAELNKIAIIHLYACGFTGDDLLNFTLNLSNPSTVAQQQKLELWRTKFEIAGSVPDGIVSKHFIRREVWGLNQDQCKALDDERYTERVVDASIEGVSVAGGGGEGSDDSLDDLPDIGGEEEPTDDAAGDDEADLPPEENAGEEPEEDMDPDLELLTSGDDPEVPMADLHLDRDKVPVKAQKHLDRVLYNRSRVRHDGARKTHMPDFGRMMSLDTKSMNDPYDSTFLRSASTNPFGESVDHSTTKVKVSLPPDTFSALIRMRDAFDALGSGNSTLVLTEDTGGVNNDSGEDSLLIVDDE
jgi:hypothetical protein